MVLDMHKFPKMREYACGLTSDTNVLTRACDVNGHIIHEMRTYNANECMQCHAFTLHQVAFECNIVITHITWMRLFASNIMQFDLWFAGAMFSMKWMFRIYVFTGVRFVVIADIIPKPKQHVSIMYVNAYREIKYLSIYHMRLMQKMNAVARAQLTFQMLTLLQKYLYHQSQY